MKFPDDSMPSRNTFEVRSADDPENTDVWFGEVAGLIHGIEPAGAIVERMASEAARCLEDRAGVALV